MTPKQQRFKAHAKPGHKRLNRKKILSHYHFFNTFFQCLCYIYNLYISCYFRNPSEIVVTKSSRGSHILKALVKQKTKIMDISQNQISENEEVISPEVRVGPA